MGDLVSEINLFSLLGILLLNLLVGLSLERYGTVSVEELKRIRVAHIFWTANWLFWLFSWFAIANNQLQGAVILNDLGAFCLIACAIVLSSNVDGAKRYILPLCTFFTMDVIYMLSFHFLVHENTPGALDESNINFLSQVAPGQWSQVVSDMVHHHTVLFGPSLSLTMLALGLVSWILARSSRHFELGIVVGFVGVLYAFAQITVYQSGLLVPFVALSDGSRLFLIGWRILFVTAYWFAMAAAAGIVIQGTRIWGVVTTTAGLLGSLAGLINVLMRKH